jgi:uncharacterized DUF497 family protein
LFTWDSAKNESNRRKHGISFETAVLVFEDPLHLSRQDRFEQGEVRWQTLGMAAGVVLLLVAHTWRDEGNGEEHIRIISAPPSTTLATRQERTIYENAA